MPTSALLCEVGYDRVTSGAGNQLPIRQNPREWQSASIRDFDVRSGLRVLSLSRRLTWKTIHVAGFCRGPPSTHCGSSLVALCMLQTRPVPTPGVLGQEYTSPIGLHGESVYLQVSASRDTSSIHHGLRGLVRQRLSYQLSRCWIKSFRHHAYSRRRLTELQYYQHNSNCLLYTSPSPRDGLLSRMPSSA